MVIRPLSVVRKFGMMRVFIFVFNLITGISCFSQPINVLPRFWTNTGFCPAGEVSNEGISGSLLSREVKVNLQLIGALPNGALSSVRIHWLLELIELIQFESHNIPEYDFSKLDKLVWWLDRREMALGFEFMGNPSGIFTKNSSIADYLWEDLSFQIAKRYLNRLGPSKLEKWRFESWNEPDLSGYNILHFNRGQFQTYLHSLRRGLNAAGRRPVNSVHFKLHGPAGLFKRQNNHPLCWDTLKNCNDNMHSCPINVLTYHHKGSGISGEVAAGGVHLLEDIFDALPNLTEIPVANDEADPISVWSTPRDFQADVRYAVALVSIIFDHWTAKLHTRALQNLDYISHDNAFISYHPYEFSQRTLFAHFRMNNSKPLPYYQFIQKPVYAALGMMGSLATHAADIETISETIRVWRTSDGEGKVFLSLIAISDATIGTHDRFQKEINSRSMRGHNFSYVVEFLEYQSTDPVYVWNFYNAPSYPNRTVREAMRRNQGPALYTTGTLAKPILYVNLPLRSPWLVHIRLCADSSPPPPRPRSLQIIPLTTSEVFILWKEMHQDIRCVVTYQVWFAAANETLPREVTFGWHTPFLSFHFAPSDHCVKGTYIVRSVDTFGRLSEFSKAKKYM